MSIPRARDSSFEPQSVKKRQRRLDGFAAKVLALYARGLSTRESQDHLEELDGVEVSPTRIATVPDAVLDAGRAWQSRPLASVHPLLYCEALCGHSPQEGPGQPTAVYRALGIPMEGEKALVGLWLSESAGAQCWGAVCTELHHRGVEDGCMAGVDGLKGLPEAREPVLPKTPGQLCIVPKVRHSLKAVPWKERQAVAADLRAISGAATVLEAEQALERVAERWDAKAPPAARAGWRTGSA
jgi:transposase-like protein